MRLVPDSRPIHPDHPKAAAKADRPGPNPESPCPDSPVPSPDSRPIHPDRPE